MNDYIARIKVPLLDRQLDSVIEAVKLGQLVSGPHLELLEQKLAALFGKKYVVLTANGFAALFLSLKSALKTGSSVTTSPASTCFAMVNAIKAAGFDVQYQDMDVQTASLGANNAEVCPVLVPDHFGLISDAVSRQSVSLADPPGFIIEDACQSFISRSKIATDADVVVVSFYATKLVNGIDGGALMTDDKQIFQKAKKLVYYADQYEYESQARFNLKLNNINAAFALATLDCLSKIEQSLTQTYQVFSEVLQQKGIKYLATRDCEVASKMLIMTDSRAQKQQWVDRLETANIQCADELMYVCPKEQVADMPKAQKLVDQSFCIPFHSELTAKQINHIQQQLKQL